jgi:hypothetical protein
MTDTAYNNAMRSNYEAASQSFTPMIETTTNRKLIVACDIRNKLCSNKKLCSSEHRHLECKKNYPTCHTMASVEYKSTKQNLESIRQQGIINVTGIVSDGCNQIPRLIRDLKMEHQYSIDHYTCCVHSNRTTQKHVKHLKFVSKYKNNDTFQRQLSVVISQRITRELKRVNKLYFNNSNFNNCNFIEKAHLAIISVPQCVSGDHSQCKNSSLICKGGRHLDCTTFLPNSDVHIK